jgi:uncharacterized protein YbjT (DUF2867 family)
MTILVVGATGALGSLAAEAARADGHRVAAMVRDLSSPAARRLRSAGVRMRLGDLKVPGDVEAAVRGAASVVITATATLSRRDGDSLAAVDGEGIQSLLTACVRGGVERVVLVSFSRSIGDDFPLARFKRAAERRLESSSLRHCILLPSYFPDKFLTPLVGFDVAAGRVRVFGDGTAPVSYITAADVARAAARCAAGAGASAVISMGGPRACSQLEVVELAERVTGRKLALDFMSLDQIESAMVDAGDPLVQSYLGLYRGLARGDAASSDWAAALGLPLTPLEEWARSSWGGRNGSPAWQQARSDPS